jgi:hypothetical protein
VTKMVDSTQQERPLDEIIDDVTLKAKYCKNGKHEMTQANTYMRPNGGRMCRACARARSRKWSANNPEKNLAMQRKWRVDNLEKCRAKGRKWRSENLSACRESWLRYRFGISIEDYSRMFEQQGGRCAICQRHQTELKKTLHVDHDHKTGEVRGLLCVRCNSSGLGAFSDSREVVERALDYLARAEGGAPVGEILRTFRDPIVFYYVARPGYLLQKGE